MVLGSLASSLLQAAQAADSKVRTVGDNTKAVASQAHNRIRGWGGGQGCDRRLQLTPSEAFVAPLPGAVHISLKQAGPHRGADSRLPESPEGAISAEALGIGIFRPVSCVARSTMTTRRRCLTSRGSWKASSGGWIASKQSAEAPAGFLSLIQQTVVLCPLRCISSKWMILVCPGTSSPLSCCSLISGPSV